MLDEPTNDLDLITLNTLEAYLEAFEGCLILVSHDRYFMDKLVDHLFVFDGSREIKDFPGNYTDFRLAQNQERKEKAKPVSSTKSNQKEPKEKKKLSFKEKQEFEALEKDIPALETEKKDLTEKLNSGEADHEKLIEWSTRIEQINESLDEKEMRWLELSEYL